jgi:sterol desaturase/sphingolipid hydroxylase (fatty acid hydroxylase superfamily)
MGVDTPAYRRDFRPRIPTWYRGWPHFVLTNVMLGGLTVWLVGRTHAPRPLEWLTVPAAFVVANLVEYLAHRHPLHRPMALSRYIYKAHALQHHRFFTGESPENMTTPDARDFAVVLFGPASQAAFLLGIGLPVGLALRLLTSANCADLFGATATAYFLTYEWLHLLYHLPASNPLTRLPGLARLQRHHLRHHDLRLMARWNFNITFPIFDRVFGTTWHEEARPHQATVEARG